MYLRVQLSRCCCCWRMTKWASCEKTARTERPFKTNNRKQRVESQTQTQSEPEPESANTSILVSCDSRLATWAHCGRHFKNLQLQRRRQLRDHATQNSISLFGVRYSVSFDLISSFSLSFLGTGPGRGGGKVLFELCARWVSIYRCTVFCNLNRIWSPENGAKFSNVFIRQSR